VTRAMAEVNINLTLRGSIVCKNSDSKFNELRIAQSYIKLLCLLEGEHGTRIVSLTRVGDYEIRMVEGSQTNSVDAPLFWIEVFDHDAQSSADSCVCHNIKEAGVAFEFHFAVKVVQINFSPRSR
jgi:hypothetical protein